MIRLAEARKDWALGFVDEVWWSRFAKPNMHSWAPEEEPLRLVEQNQDKGDEEPKALACYGVLLKSLKRRGDVPSPKEGRPKAEVSKESRDQMLLRFVKGRPVSEVTCDFLEWVLGRLEEQGKRVWALIWDNASWHKSWKVRCWIREHNREAKREGGVRILACLLPTKSPWLNPIEPEWLHGKRAVVKPEGELTPEEVMDRQAWLLVAF